MRPLFRVTAGPWALAMLAHIEERCYCFMLVGLMQSGWLGDEWTIKHDDGNAKRLPPRTCMKGVKLVRALKARQPSNTCIIFSTQHFLFLAVHAAAGCFSHTRRILFQSSARKRRKLPGIPTELQLETLCTARLL